MLRSSFHRVSWIDFTRSLRINKVLTKKKEVAEIREKR